MEVVGTEGAVCAATSGADDVVSSTCNGAEADAVETANGARQGLEHCGRRRSALRRWILIYPACRRLVVLLLVRHAWRKTLEAAYADEDVRFGKIGRLWDEAVRAIWVLGTGSKSEMTSVNPALIRDGCEKARWISPPNPCPADPYQSRMLTRINQADFKCVMAAMDLDHQLSDTSRAAKEAEPEEAERSYAESELSLECDDRSPRSGRGAEWSRVEFELNLPSGCGAVIQDAEMTFTQVDKLGEDRRSDRSDVESEAGVECDV
ncbi:hypothetical protein PHYSODRAFT_329331 [Phytophthora sojae]|uniref:Uncharacterized protein n=1 Tax=Phytophthora sojae (strain P6497) TaxID=1094619 RepID=G4Z238_PHYSP|nr:hypothetical protein PHYSODRAFT_329331 [Phytophthora sojae]EGZ21373.1 hypothetical protein PHYSODRAFT_329331 [Phytophthora sojae]|eukprot:XP_009524090.1 hypothetical protein PHYSODRAFT_329331 [Phytophthora sojae]